jgi:uncharacterized membrane protein YoaK (UPF0700 family)
VRLSSPETVSDAMLVLLSAAAGCVDAVSYLGLGHIFTANMTGNTVLLGLSLGQADWQAALRSSVALVGFIMGVAVGAVIAGGDQKGRAVWPMTVTVTLTVELAVLGAFALGLYLAGGASHTLILLAALAMGLQSTAVRCLGIPGVATTYITGTLTGVIEGAISRLYLAIFSAATPGGRDERRSEQAATSARLGAPGGRVVRLRHRGDRRRCPRISVASGWAVAACRDSSAGGRDLSCRVSAPWWKA